MFQLIFKFIQVLMLCMLCVSLNASRGINNNNPGNLRPQIGKRLNYQIAADRDGFAVFDSPESGIRAIKKNLIIYKKKHGINTVEGIILRWTKNDIADKTEYINYVSKQMKVKPTQALTLNKKQIKMLVKSIIIFENGYCPYSDKLINKALG